MLYNLADRFAYTRNVYGGDEGIYWRNRDAIDAQYDYNDRRATTKKGVVPIADLSWTPNDHDDDTNEALGYWYRDHGKLPGLDHQSEFDYMNQEYSRQKAAGERMADGANKPTQPEADKRDGVSSDDLLLSVMEPEQLERLSKLNDQVLGTLNDRQKQQIASGEANLGSIFDQLSFDQQEQINQLSQSLMSALSPEQKTDLLFLSSGMLNGYDLQKRKAILWHLKENDGTISYGDLVRMGVYQPGDLAEDGFERWLQNMDIGGPAHLHELLEEEYKLNNLDTSFAKLDQEDRQRRSAQQTMLFAMAAAPVIDRVLYGPGSIAFGNNVYDNIERYGTQGNFKGLVPTEKGVRLGPEFFGKTADPSLQFGATPKKVGESAGDGGKPDTDGIIRDGSQLENGRLKPNISYQSGEHNYVYRTNENGLIANARTDGLQIKTHSGRLNHNPNTYGKVEGDQAGHLFGDRFGGSPELDNLVSQARNVNQSEFKIIENRWANALRNRQQVTVDITINYTKGNARPVSFDISYTIDGVPFFSSISN